MHIIADANMPGLEPFEAFATVERVDGRTPVSYTHLTLPTILRV